VLFVSFVVHVPLHESHKKQINYPERRLRK
jgi:hypothetical protein